MRCLKCFKRISENSPQGGQKYEQSKGIQSQDVVIDSTWVAITVEVGSGCILNLQYFKSTDRNIF